MRKENLSSDYKNFSGTAKNESEKGSAILIALFIMLLLLSFVALAVTRTTSETVASSNDQAETRTFTAAHASLEVMTRNFNKIFDVKLNPDDTDLTRIEGQVPPEFTNYTFQQEVNQTQASQIVVMTGEQFQGLNAIRDKWELLTTATENSTDVKVALRREFFNNRIPIFQFGIFYEDDMELHPGPRFDFGGRVHSNGSLFLMAQTGLYFASKVTAVQHIFTDVAKNGRAATGWGENVFIKNASGNYVQLKYTMGSVLNTVVNGSPVTSAPNYPTTYKSANWKSNSNLFQGNLLSNQSPLNLPIKINNTINGAATDYVELIKRGKSVGDLYNFGSGAVAVTAANADDSITFKERYYNKSGIRVTLADSKAKLPGCATSTGAAVTTVCGVRLDGDDDGLGGDPNPSSDARGYIPRPMVESVGSYQATRINGERFYVAGRELWIKIETVGYNGTTNVFEALDITQDILSLGVTEQAKTITSGSTTLFAVTEPNYASNNYDSRSVIKLQRFMFGGATVVNSNGSTTNFITNATWNGVNYNFVHAATKPSSGSQTRVDNGSFGGVFGGDHQQHFKKAIIDSSSNENWIVPFPINMFDTREGLYYEGTSVFNPTAAGNYGTKVPYAGVMSMVDVDVKNLRDFLSGVFDGKMPTGTPFAIAAGRTLRSTDIHDSNGWVLYVSDRRGDNDFDGEYDMEDVYGNNDGILQTGEDINNNGSLEADYFNEAVRYTGASASVSPDIAALFEHKFYRRGVRLINAAQLPGIYDSANPANTKGFTVASENGVYVFGNYNATGIASVGTPTPSSDYYPQNTANHIPASIAADAVTVLSNNWSDARSFDYPFNLSQRVATETYIRFAMLSGDSRSSLETSPNQGGSDPNLAGGVHNFKRFLENWGGVRLNYTGSLINLFNSHNNNGTFKCCSIIYSPPTRNWAFDQSFLDPNRLPPGTPFFQSIQLTGFQRIN